MSDRTVVIVEDDVLIAHYFRDVCERIGVKVLEVRHQAQGTAERIIELAPDYVLLDVRLGGRRDGVDIGRDVFEGNPAIKLVYVTGSNEPPQLDRIRSDHPYQILIKPVRQNDIAEALDRLD